MFTTPQIAAMAAATIHGKATAQAPATQGPHLAPLPATLEEGATVDVEVLGIPATGVTMHAVSTTPTTLLASNAAHHITLTGKKAGAGAFTVQVTVAGKVTTLQGTITVVAAAVAPAPDLTGFDTSHIYPRGQTAADYGDLEVGKHYVIDATVNNQAAFVAALQAGTITLKWASDDVTVATVTAATGHSAALIVQADVDPVAAGGATISCDVIYKGASIAHASSHAQVVAAV